MQSVNPVLPRAGFAVERLLPPRQAIVAFFSRVTISPPQVELVSLDEALGRVLAEPIAADDDYPNAPRSAMDGFALSARATPGEFEIVGAGRHGLGARRFDRRSIRLPDSHRRRASRGCGRGRAD